MTEQEIVDYAQWILSDCEEPVSEIEYLVEMILTDDRNIDDIRADLIETINAVNK